MADNVFQKTGAKIADSAEQFAKVKDKITDAWDDGVNAANRAVKRGREATEDFIDDASRTVKGKPLESVAITFGVAFGIGVLVGWLLRSQAD